MFCFEYSFCSFIGILQSSSDSYFRYLPGENFNTFHDPFFTPMFRPSFDNVDLEDQARAVCGSDEFCLFDIAATKNINIGMATMQGGEAFNDIEEMAIPSKYRYTFYLEIQCTCIFNFYSCL